MAREKLGTMPCPECGHPEAEIKRQKCGVKIYRYCPECNAQFFARTPAQEAAMLKIINQNPVTVKEQEPENASPPQVSAPAPAQAQKKAEEAPKKAQPPVPAPKKAAPKKTAPPPPVPPENTVPATKKSAFGDALSFMIGK